MEKLQAVHHNFLTENVLRSLGQSGITTILDFLREDIEKLSLISRLNISQVLSLRSHIFSKYSAPLINGTTLHKLNLMKRKFIKTGLPGLDKILDGGIPIGFIIEISGLADSGKTQLCLHLAINCVKDRENTVLYIDTKGDFSAIRIQRILDAQGLSHKEIAIIMHKIKVVHIWTMEDIILLLKKIKTKILNFTDLSLIIIDSLPCLMFQYLGDDNKIGLALLNKLVNYCRYLCSNKNLSIVCINMQTRWVDQDVSDLDDDPEQTDTAFKEIIYVEKQKRCLGNYWSQVPAVLLSLEKSSVNDLCDIHRITIKNNTYCERENRKFILNLSTSGLICL